MITLLKTNKDDSADVVSETTVCIGHEFIIERKDKSLRRKVTGVIEQRKERGIYINESNRRFWAKVNHESNNPL